QTILELSFWIRTPVNWQVQHFKLSSWRSRNKLEIFSAAIFSHEASSSGDVSPLLPVRSTERFSSDRIPHSNPRLGRPGTTRTAPLPVTGIATPPGHHHGADRRLLTPGLETGSAPQDARPRHRSARPTPKPRLKEKFSGRLPENQSTPMPDLTRAGSLALAT